MLRQTQKKENYRERQLSKFLEEFAIETIKTQLRFLLQPHTQLKPDMTDLKQRV